ncbi:MAG: putative sugar nucleotidyl transferase [Ignavibacteria bacterium]|nr:putative sugar nucleotidyl transferase [Ignavibacteria bacterium]
MIQPKYIILFENNFFRSLFPFYLLHLQWEVRCGCLRIFEKVQKEFPEANLIFYSERANYLALFQEKYCFHQPKLIDGNLLVLNSGILPSKEFWSSLQKSYEIYLKESPPFKSVIFSSDGLPLALYITKDEILNPNEFDIKFYTILPSKYSEKIPQLEIPRPKILNFLWDAIEFNSFAILDDFRYYKNFADFDELRKQNVFIYNQDYIKIGKNCSIAPNVVLDARKGPIVIGNNATIQPFVYINGPVFLGEDTTVKAGSMIYEGTSIGEVCKVGGEIENSIIQAYSNKQHYGFLGHSYIGEWVNIGAGTTTSDLKNTYETISVRIENETFDTGRTFLGLICGDHTRTAINTSFNTGTITGICCNIYHHGLLSKYIPSFTWGGKKGESIIGNFERTIESIETMMGRRGKKLNETEKKILEMEFTRQKAKSR